MASLMGMRFFTLLLCLLFCSFFLGYPSKPLYPFLATHYFPCERYHHHETIHIPHGYPLSSTLSDYLILYGWYWNCLWTVPSYLPDCKLLEDRGSSPGLFTKYTLDTWCFDVFILCVLRSGEGIVIKDCLPSIRASEATHTSKGSSFLAHSGTTCDL